MEILYHLYKGAPSGENNFFRKSDPDLLTAVHRHWVPKSNPLRVIRNFQRVVDKRHTI
jgi:hypothetical protein